MKINSVSQRIANWINKSDKVQNVLRSIADSPALFNTVGATIVGTTIRPAITIGITPNKRDGMYSAASSIASSAMELIGGVLMLTPLRKGVDRSSKELFDAAGTVFYKNKELLRGYKSTAQRIYKMFTFPITSAVRFAMVVPISIALSKLGITKASPVGNLNKVA